MQTDRYKATDFFLSTSVYWTSFSLWPPPPLPSKPFRAPMHQASAERQSQESLWFWGRQTDLPIVEGECVRACLLPHNKPFIPHWVAPEVGCVPCPSLMQQGGSRWAELSVRTLREFSIAQNMKEASQRCFSGFSFTLVAMSRQSRFLFLFCCLGFIHNVT